MRPAVIELCRKYVEGFGSQSTHLVYHHRLNGPKGLGALSSPDEIAAGTVRGKEMPYGYGSGIQDVALEGGHFLFALCDAWDATQDAYFADAARSIFSGMKRIAAVSPVPGFVPRGPHPDGKSYYRDSSLDQHTTFVYALWRFSRSPLAAEEDRRFIADTLEKVAQRMEKNGWGIRVEDGSKQAHVGFVWLQHTCIGAEVLLSFLASVHDATGNDHWRQLYERMGGEKDGVRWRLLSADSLEKWPPLTLYSNQFAVGLAALSRTEKDEGRRAQLKEMRKRLAERALRSNVFDERLWRRLDWAGEWSSEQIEENLKPFGLSQQNQATVFDIYRRFDAGLWAGPYSPQRKVNDKLCFGIPTVAFHMALLSGDPALVREVRPHVEDMVRKMLDHGHLYTSGENFNRSVVVGLHLLALLNAR